MLTSWLQEHTQGFTAEPITHGCSTARVFKLTQPIGPARYVKVAPNTELPALKREVNRMRWLENKAPVPEVITFVTRGKETAIIMSAIPGDPLSAFGEEPKDLRELYAWRLGEALQQFHSISLENCPFQHSSAGGSPAPDGLDDAEKAQWLHRLHAQFGKPTWQVFLHGDPSLPNVLVKDDEITGFVDLGAAGIGDPFRDLALALWSLERNFGPGLDSVFLEGYARL